MSENNQESVVVYEPGEGQDRPLVEQINGVLNRELKSPETVKALLATTFKGLQPVTMKQALMEGMIRGFSFKDFLQKDVYAVPFGGSYSLVTSIEHARKRGMRSGVVGVSAPEYTYKADGKVETCAITVKRMASNVIGEFTALVFFDEYTTGKNLWTSKPRTMIAKVAEMHALRKACPEELAHIYVEEEFDSEKKQATRFEEATAASKPLQLGNLQTPHAKKESSKKTADETADSEATEDNAQPED